MKILVAIKQVAGRDSLLKPNAEATWIDESDLSFEVNEPDAYALEAALQLSEGHGGEVVALCAGPERVSRAIREALAKGAHRAIHVAADHLEAWDPLDIARLLAKAAATESPDLVLTGLQSDDLGSGQTGVIMAELMGLAHATIIMEIEKTDGGIRVKRELEAGWFQHIDLPLPAVLTIQSGISKLRYATLMGIKRAKTKEVKRLTPEELGVTPASRTAVARIYAPSREKKTQILDDAAALVEKLKFEARVLS